MIVPMGLVRRCTRGRRGYVKSGHNASWVQTQPRQLPLSLRRYTHSVLQPSSIGKYGAQRLRDMHESSSQAPLVTNPPTKPTNMCIRSKTYYETNVWALLDFMNGIVLPCFVLLPRA